MSFPQRASLFAPTFLLVCTVSSALGWVAFRHIHGHHETLIYLHPSPTAPVELSKVYPYSVVSGGVSSTEGVEQAMRGDLVVRDHYSDIHERQLTKTFVKDGKKYYMSYRVGDKVYWTARKSKLKDGETMLSDGHNLIRGRCGNRLSETPKSPVRSREPTEVEMGTPSARRR